MHRARQRCFELLALIGSPQLLKVIPQVDKTLGRTGQTLRACTAAEACKMEVVMISQESTTKDVKLFGYFDSCQLS